MDKIEALEDQCAEFQYTISTWLKIINFVGEGKQIEEERDVFSSSEEEYVNPGGQVDNKSSEEEFIGNNMEEVFEIRRFSLSFLNVSR